MGERKRNPAIITPESLLTHLSLGSLIRPDTRHKIRDSALRGGTTDADHAADWSNRVHDRVIGVYLLLVCGSYKPLHHPIR
jgi:hypothetical protein